MSWMDSWSRPSKSQATPAPFYLLPGGEETPYCKSCGRVISARKSHATNAANTPAKYCSSRCRNHKPGKVDREIEQAFVKFLKGAEELPQASDGNTKAKGKGQKKKKKKGDPRILVSCDAVEKYVFGDHSDPDKVYGRKRNRARHGEHTTASEASTAEGVTVTVEHEPLEGVKSAFVAKKAQNETIDGDVLARLAVRSGTRVRPSQEVSQVNGSVGGEKGRAERIEETEEMLEKREQGQKRAQEREMVRCAARRGVAFGFVVKQADDDQTEARRKCEAVMQGKVVEASFAKGDWGVRWREG
ncbi:hypothetical protein B0J12DRAFT_708283 [Macrophomina phaseolina]|uniref:Chitinase n=1 Tax=Macrophomina phaseolina TaxID=35725 RepID=A0ABQ8GL84_9PEZI|nr:hypothetical protein B0J12DRAFT_708283 [Macrophomina phaseolina]